MRHSLIAWICVGAAFAIMAFFLLGEHRVHALGFLPFFLLFLCPFLHLFGHGSHEKHLSRSETEGSGEVKRS
jgi:Protein of unknown function (DUF2933)